MSQMLPTTRHSISLAQRTNIAVLVGLSRLLRHLKPDRLQRLMSLVVRGAQPANYSIARDARDDILSASAVCRGDRACLIRSVAAMLLCRQRGYAPTWCVGVVATPPFAAHAWIEADNRIVDEPIDASYLRTFYRVGASAQA